MLGGEVAVSSITRCSLACAGPGAKTVGRLDLSEPSIEGNSQQKLGVDTAFGQSGGGRWRLDLDRGVRGRVLAVCLVAKVVSVAQTG